MKLNELKPKIKPQRKKRVGRGISAGHGKTAGRGTKGQKARKSVDMPKRFEGGQTPLVQRLPKVGGFRSLKQKPRAISYKTLEKKFTEGSKITPDLLFSAGLIDSKKEVVKIVGFGEKRFQFEGVLLSKKLADRLSKDKQS